MPSEPKHVFENIYFAWNCGLIVSRANYFNTQPEILGYRHFTVEGILTDEKFREYRVSNFYSGANFPEWTKRDFFQPGERPTALAIEIADESSDFKLLYRMTYDPNRLKPTILITQTNLYEDLQGANYGLMKFLGQDPKAFSDRPLETVFEWNIEASYLPNSNLEQAYFGHNIKFTGAHPEGRGFVTTVLKSKSQTHLPESIDAGLSVHTEFFCSMRYEDKGSELPSLDD